MSISYISIVYSLFLIISFLYSPQIYDISLEKTNKKGQMSS